VSTASRQVELARTPLGAKKVAKSILLNEYGFSEKEYKCLNSLWNKESHWNYKARNKNSGAHGIAQALPASKMNVVSTDWRTNPVTQIRWGLRYISIRYETPCKALAKHNHSNYY
jgi:membrane-bound lytic murein transglycosylase MltF